MSEEFRELISELREIKVKERASDELLARKIGVSIFTISRWWRFQGTPNPGSIKLIRQFINDYNREGNSVLRESI
ncbi:MAG: hypothetical protein ACOC5G_04055 [Acidobacteriota bacterium]